VWTVIQVVRAGVWLCGVPFWLRWYPLPRLLARLTPAGVPSPTRSVHDLQRVVSLMVRVCQLRLFRLPWFPRACLRQSLALYYLLCRLGYAVTIHFGVRKEEDLLQGHSWVTVQGVPVVADAVCAGLHVVYAYPPVIPVPPPATQVGCKETQR
jgi:Transglutaminase-like superfamily